MGERKAVAYRSDRFDFASFGSRPPDLGANRSGASSISAFFLRMLSVLLLVVPGSALACSFHNYKPAKTLVDWMLKSETIALARPDPDNPMKFKVTKFFRGQELEKDIPFLVDSTSRRRLAINPDDGVLFAVDESGNWRTVGYIDTDYRRILNSIIENAAAWRDEEFHPGRFSVFSDYQDHPDPKLRRLALQEIDRVPYSMLRTMQVHLSETELLKSLRSWNDYPYRQINFLLLGLTGTSMARSHLHKQVERMLDQKIADSLGAVATALIELEGARGVEKLAGLYLSDESQPLDKLESIVQAMAVHNSLGSPDLKRAVKSALVDFVARHPNGAAMIARQFSALRDWSIGPQLEMVLQTPGGLNPSSRLMVAVYVAQSKVGGK